jgi:hypothetical protein
VTRRNDLPPDLLTYYAARREHAWRLRRDNLTLREIGARLGVSDTRARGMIFQHQRGLA